MSKPTLEIVNAILARIAPGYRFQHGYREALWLKHATNGSQAVRLRRSDRLWLVDVNRRLSLAGTIEQAIAQLVLFLRDQPRWPLAWWEYLCSPQVGLADASLVQALVEAGYDAIPARRAACSAASTTRHGRTGGRWGRSSGRRA